MKSKTAIVVITALISVVVTSLVWVAGIALVVAGYFLSMQGTGPYLSGANYSGPPFALKVEAPHYATLGEEIVLDLQVSNPTDEDLQLGNIDVYDSLLDGFTVVQTDPGPNSEDHSMGYLTLYYEKVLEPGESFGTSLRLKAKAVGVWTGDVDFCTPEGEYVTSSVTIRVKAEPDSAGND